MVDKPAELARVIRAVASDERSTWWYDINIDDGDENSLANLLQVSNECLMTFLADVGWVKKQTSPRPCWVVKVA